MKSRKFGRLFLIEKFYRNALDQIDRHELINKTSINYLKKFYEEAESYSNLSEENSPVLLDKMTPETKNAWWKSKTENLKFEWCQNIPRAESNEINQKWCKDQTDAAKVNKSTKIWFENSIIPQQQYRMGSTQIKRSLSFIVVKPKEKSKKWIITEFRYKYLSNSIIVIK